MRGQRPEFLGDHRLDLGHRAPPEIIGRLGARPPFGRDADSVRLVAASHRLSGMSAPGHVVAKHEQLVGVRLQILPRVAPNNNDPARLDARLLGIFASFKFGDHSALNSQCIAVSGRFGSPSGRTLRLSGTRFQYSHASFMSAKRRARDSSGVSFKSPCPSCASKSMLSRYCPSYFVGPVEALPSRIMT